MRDLLDHVHDSKAAIALAEYFADLARRAAARAAMLKERAANWKPPPGRLRPVEMIATYVASGNTLDAATRTVAAQTGLSPNALTDAYEAYARSRERAQRRERDKAILAMAGRGMRDKEIAAAIGLTRKHVNKIVRREIRRAQTRHSQPKPPTLSPP